MKGDERPRMQRPVPLPLWQPLSIHWFLASVYTMEKRIKTAQVNLRIDPKLKAAAEKAAADDNRSLTSLIEKLLLDNLKKAARKK
jgi:hypothetical protein